MLGISPFAQAHLDVSPLSKLRWRCHKFADTLHNVRRTKGAASLEQMIHFKHESVYRGILGTETNQAEIKLHCLLKIFRTLAPCLGINEIAHRNAPRRFEDALNFFEESRRQPIERIGILRVCPERSCWIA